MNNALEEFGDNTESFSIALGTNEALRHKIINKITPILLASDRLPDSQSRLVVQACCLDIVAAIEELIQENDLEKSPVSRRK